MHFLCVINYASDSFVLLKGVSVAGLLHGVDDGLVDTEGDGDAEQCQEQVGDDADHAECCQRQQQQQGNAKHHTCLFRVPPVHQVIHCKTENACVWVHGRVPWERIQCGVMG